LIGKIWITVFGLALLALSGVVHAGTYFGFSNGDMSFEVYRGNSYAAVAVPYTYAYSGNYYFDYPFRVNYVNQYYYYNSGWYNFNDGYWTITGNSFCSTCYSYYSPSYYYYDNYWSYSPGWVYNYGPMYYGSYFLPPGQATLVGQQYQPKQEAKCTQLSLSTETVSVNAGGKEEVVFYINNFSRMDLDVADVTIFIDGFGADARSVRFDDVVKSHSRAKVQFEVQADSDAEGDSFTGTAELSGTFRDGTYCAPSEVSDDFTVNVNGNSQAQITYVPQVTQSNVQGSVSYLQAKDSQQNWNEVVDYGTSPNYGNSNTQNYVNNNYNSQSYGSTNQTVTTYYGEKQLLTQSCSGLSIVSKSVVVDSGNGKTVYYTLKNFASEDFRIDSMEGLESSPDFEIAMSMDNARAYANSEAALKARFSASETPSGQDSTGTAYIKVSGHYGSGMQCDVFSDNFYVRVNGTDNSSAADISLDSPAQLGIAGTSGFLTFALENPSNEQVTVTASSNDASVSPAKFTFAAKTGGTRTIAINGFNEKEGKVFLTVEVNGSQTLKKYVKLVSKGPAQNATQNAANSNANAQGLGSIISTGFAALGSNALALGLVLLVLMIGFAYYATRQ